MGSAVVISVLMVITGSINTISTKWADITESKDIRGEKTEFNHPFFQAACMFFGELCCLFVFKINEFRKGRAAAAGSNMRYVAIQNEDVGESPRSDEPTQWNPVIFLLPACCDMTATSLMYIGLSWTYASIFQMLRGSVMIFTGIFSVVFLKRKLGKHQWLGMVVVLIGLTLVGVSSIMGPSDSNNAPNPVGGVIVIVIAQLVQATQMVVEEKYLTKYEGIEPLQAVGWEGFWGFLVLSTLLVPMYWIPGTATGGRLENAPDAFVQMGNSVQVMIAILGNIVSIGFFNFFGVTVTRTISATTRMVLDSVRTLVIWVFSLMIGWQKFQYMQAVGFPFLVLGMFIYNGSLKVPGLQYDEDKKQQQLAAGEGDTAESKHLADSRLVEGTLSQRRRKASLHDVLGLSIGFEMFTKYCTEARSRENLKFWGAVERFKQGGGGSRDDVLAPQQARIIMETYVTNSAMHQVNLPAKLRRALEERMEAGDIDRRMFSTAQECIYDLIQRDVFPRFKNSTAFEEFIDILEEHHRNIEIGESKQETQDQDEHRGITIKPTLRVG